MLGTSAPLTPCSDHSPQHNCICSFHPRWQSQCFHISGHRSPTLHIHCGLKDGNIEKPEVSVKFFAVTLSSLVEPLEKVTGQYLQQTRRLDINEKNQHKKCHSPIHDLLSLATFIPLGQTQVPPSRELLQSWSQPRLAHKLLAENNTGVNELCVKKRKSAKLEILNTTRIVFQSNIFLPQWVMSQSSNYQ